MARKSAGTGETIRRDDLDQADGSVLRVYLANERLLPATDPYSRQVVMSAGGFLALLADAASAAGYRAEITRFPECELEPMEGASCRWPW